MSRKIGEHWYDLPESLKAVPAKTGFVLLKVMDLAKFVSEERQTTPESHFERRPCRRCGAMIQLGRLRIVETPAGWRMLCATCCTAGNSDPSNRL